ncbi:unnamed protein product [Linum trigynum]|uniref:DUF4216 domain-containing protein n=1 Tax=Linum trigynum TaxID=586398 RepID=A0AAV2CTW6_9ROSI
MDDKEPFIMASQAQQVFYVDDPIEKNWKVVVRTTPRDLCDMSIEGDEEDVDTYLQSEAASGEFSEDIPNDGDTDWISASGKGSLVDASPESSAGIRRRAGFEAPQVEDDDEVGDDNMDVEY